MGLAKREETLLLKGPGYENGCTGQPVYKQITKLKTTLDCKKGQAERWNFFYFLGLFNQIQFFM